MAEASGVCSLILSWRNWKNSAACFTQIGNGPPGIAGLPQVWDLPVGAMHPASISTLSLSPHSGRRGWSQTTGRLTSISNGRRSHMTSPTSALSVDDCIRRDGFSGSRLLAGPLDRRVLLVGQLDMADVDGEPGRA